MRTIRSISGFRCPYLLGRRLGLEVLQFCSPSDDRLRQPLHLEAAAEHKCSADRNFTLEKIYAALKTARTFTQQVTSVSGAVMLVLQQNECTQPHV